VYQTTTPKSDASSGFLIATACLLLLLSFGYRAGFGLFVRPITEANGWGREIISIALAVQNLFWGIIAFFAGGLADRFGNVKVVVAGAFLYALGMVLMPGVDNPWQLNASAGILVGAGIAGTCDPFISFKKLMLLIAVTAAMLKFQMIQSDIWR